MDETIKTKYIDPKGILSPELYVYVPARPQKFDFLYRPLPIFCTIIHLSVYHFPKESPPILLKFGAFHHILLKIHPIYVICAPSSLMKTHRSLCQISRNSTPEGRHIYLYHVNVRPPPRYIEYRSDDVTKNVFCISAFWMDTMYRWSMMKNIHSPNLVGISSCRPEIWPHEYLISPIKISVN